MSHSFKFQIVVNEDGSGAWSATTDQDGVTVGHVVPHVAQVLAQLVTNMGFPIVPNDVLAMRAAREAEARRLPDGWAPSLDGVNVEMAADMTVKAYTKNFVRTDGVTIAAPCDANGNPTPETRTAIVLFEKSESPTPAVAGEA